MRANLEFNKRSVFISMYFVSLMQLIMDTRKYTPVNDDIATYVVSLLSFSLLMLILHFIYYEMDRFKIALIVTLAAVVSGVFFGSFR